MLKRWFDVAVGVVGLALAAPLMLLAATAVRLAGPGPILYRAVRVGRGGRPFEMLKFRTMRHDRAAPGPVITGASDARVFPLGALLRRTKIDELPQLVNVLRGEMSVVGPRPEAPEIVAAHYGEDGWKTLQVRPGLTSPGSLHYYLYSDEALSGPDPEEAYVHRLLPEKLALDVRYLARQSPLRDMGVIIATIITIVMLGLGRRATLICWLSRQAGRRAGLREAAGLGGVSRFYKETS
jgi:lipopolysaccharide/colanic/teichoic acid biosynthesis glycosyltransferase